MFLSGTLRELRRGEEPAAEALLNRAFPSNDEARLVAKLRKSGAMAGEQVLADGDTLLGYYALSQMQGPKGWLCLAPVAVDPDHHGKGLGRRMMRWLVGWAEQTGQTVVVLGDPAFYQRCGFRMAEGLTSPYPLDHTLVAGPAGSGALVYPKAFEGL